MEKKEVTEQLDKIYDSHYETFILWLRQHRHLPTLIRMLLKDDKEGMDKELALIWARDHFSTDLPEEHDCIAEFVGVIVGETKNYLKLRYVKADAKQEKSAEEYHNVMKSTITDKLIFPFRVSSIFGLTRLPTDAQK